MSLEEENELGGGESAGEQDKATGAEMIGGEVREAVRGEGAVYGEVGAGVGRIGSDGGGVGGVEVIYNPWEVLKKAPTSLVWNFFFFKQDKTRKKADDSRVYCKLCEGKRKQAGIPYNKSTTSLKSHMQNNHGEEFKLAEDSDTKKKEVKPITAFFHENSSVKWKKNSPKWKNMTATIAKWFVKDTRPAEMVEDKGFRELMALARPEYIVPCAKTITQYIDEHYIKEVDRVKQELTQFEFLAKTTDGGSATNASSFQETGVHGITNEFEMKYYTLAVREIKEKHSAENYRKNTDKVEDEFNVKDKIVLSTTDNEKKMKAAYKESERNGCFSHLMHSSLTKGMTSEKIVNETVLKQRKIITKHNKSYQVKYGLQEAQKKLGIKQRPLIQGVVNRWGSTRASTQSILDDEEDQKEPPLSAVFGNDLDGFLNAQAINETLRKHKFKNKEKLHDYLLTRVDMMRIKNINAFLTKFDIYSTTLGGNKFTTSSIVMPVMKSIQKHLEISEDDPSYIINMKNIIRDDFKERTSQNLNFSFLMKATALDPRFLKLKVISEKSKREMVFNKLIEEARENLRNIQEKDKSDVELSVTKKRKLGLDWDESDEDEDDHDDKDIIKREVIY